MEHTQLGAGMSRKTSTIAVLALLLAGSATQAKAGLIFNGDFESGNTGFSSEFVYSPTDIKPPATYFLVSDPQDSHPNAASYGDHTTGNGLMLAANGSLDSDTVVWSQEVAVTPGSDYEFEVWTSTWVSEAGLQLQINSVDVGDL
ncbi:MAG: hypothetical protein AAF961_05760, partial [Planctomycetota bacterium]